MEVKTIEKHNVTASTLELQQKSVENRIRKKVQQKGAEMEKAQQLSQV